MSYEYSEDKLIEQTAIAIFEKKLKWATITTFDTETYGKNGTLGRQDNTEVVLVRYLEQKLREFNPNLPDQAYQAAIQTITGDSSFLILPEINKDKYQLFKDGVPVTFRNDQGELIKDKRLKVFDYEEPENNHFLAVRQLWIQGKLHLRRPDIIGFVNGIPLLFIELKAAHRNLKTAYSDNLTDYKDTIPKLFYYNAVIILSNGIDSKIGAITSKYEHFNDWKRIEEDSEGIASLDTMLRGVCEKNKFMDLFENFILYDNSIGFTVKLVSRNHQFIGVNKAIEQVRNMNALQGRLGVFWHTQGSGKSYSMVMFCQKIHRKLKGAYTFVIVTDRTELDGQIYGTFSGVGAITSPEVQAGSGEELKKLLKENHRYIFTLIHKFISIKDVISEREDIIVISDEAHRTQQGLLALNMRNALPKASFIGFTGTPLIKAEEELTKQIFGDYVSVYNFKRSIEDGATVPLYYENRGDYLKLKNPKITEDIREAIEEADLDPEQSEKLEQLFSRDYPILTSEKRLDAVAKDIVWHFNTRGFKGKAMVVCIDKLTAVKMYELISKHWQVYIKEQEKQLPKVKDEMEFMQKAKDLDWSKKTEIAVVVSSEQNEIKKFRDFGLDIEPHRQKMVERDLETEFKNETHPFRLAIVCAMWITGFDVPSLSTLYLDKPLKSHTLMQTIARANRVYEGKNNGLIVDYIESYKNLLDALAIYATDEKGQSIVGDPIKPKEELVEELDQTIKATEKYLKELGFKLDKLVKADGLEKIAQIKQGVDAVYRNDETKKKFQLLAREVFKKYKALMPDLTINDFRPKKEAIDVLYTKIENDIESADISEIMKKIQGIVDDSVDVIAQALSASGQDKIIDISRLDFDKLKKNFLKSEDKNTTVQILKDQIEAKLEDMVAKNPLRIDFYKKYQEIIEEYNKGKDIVTVEKTFDALIDFVNNLSDEQKRNIREKLTEEQLAIYDLLLKPHLAEKDKKIVKEAAIQLLETLKKEKLKIEKWAEKTQVAASVAEMILSFLWEKLPAPTYASEEITQKSELVYSHVRSKYAMGLAGVYGAS